MAFPLLAVTTEEDGAVSISSLESGTWSPFVPIPQLTKGGFRNVSVSFGVGERNEFLRVCTIDDSLSSQLRFTFHDPATTWINPVLLGTGPGLASIVPRCQRDSTEVLALGGPTDPSKWSFGLPYYSINTFGFPIVRRFGDQTARLNPGPIAADDPAVAFDIWPPSSDFRVCLATASGGLYFVDATTGSSKFEDVKTTGAGDPGNVISVSVCRDNHFDIDFLHVCVVNDTGRILHTMRRRKEDGTWLPWLPWGDVNAATRSGETFIQASICYTVDQERTLHLAAVTSSGGLLYTKRTNRSPYDPLDPYWRPFIDVKATAGNPGTVTSADIDIVFEWPG